MLRNTREKVTPLRSSPPGGELHAPITAVSRAMAILGHLASAPHGLSVTELSQALGLERSITSRILTSLTAEGYTRRDPRTDFYYLTFKLSAMAYTHFSALGFPKRCVPILRELAQETGELVELAAADGEHLWYVAKVEGWHRIRLTPPGGGPVALHATASGRAWLASLPQAEALRILATQPLEQYTPHTITSLDEFMRDLESVRRMGYATSWEEYQEDASSVAVVVPSPVESETAVGTIAVAGPTFRLTREELRRLVPRLREIARAVSYVWPLSASPSGTIDDEVDAD